MQELEFVCREVQNEKFYPLVTTVSSHILCYVGYLKKEIILGEVCYRVMSPGESHDRSHGLHDPCHPVSAIRPLVPCLFEISLTFCSSPWDNVNSFMAMTLPLQLSHSLAQASSDVCRAFHCSQLITAFDNFSSSRLH